MECTFLRVSRYIANLLVAVESKLNETKLASRMLLRTRENITDGKNKKKMPVSYFPSTEYFVCMLFRLIIFMERNLFFSIVTYLPFDLDVLYSFLSYQ